MKNLIATLIFLFTALNLNSATHTVTNGNDSGEGSLRQIVADSNPNDTIIFLDNVSTVTLTSGQITINKSLTIIGNENEKTSISGDFATVSQNTRIFNIPVSNIEFNINNLIIENGKSNARSGGMDIYGGNSNKVKITNCIFRNNEGFSGGAILIAASEVIAINCLFEQNKTYGTGSAVFIVSGGNFIAKDCTFNGNIGGGGTVRGSDNSNFTIKNCTFYDNNAICGSAVYIHSSSKTHLYFNTLDKNQAEMAGGAIFNEGTLYSYNSIYTGNTEDGVVSEAGQIRGTISGNGKNLIEGKNGVTREKVFGKNEYENGYIRPLAFAKSAIPLTKYDIKVPEGMNTDSIITWLLKDQIGKERIPDSNGFVTFGAVECDDVGIREDGSFDILVLPNPTDRDFNIIFDNPETQKVAIDLIDIEGKNIFSIFDGVVSAGIQVYRVNETLASGVYFVKFVFENKVMLRKVVVRK